MTTAQRHDEHFTIWSAARAEANLAYTDWREGGGPEAYAVYRAAEDRADSAQAALAATSAARVEGRCSTPAATEPMG